MRHLKGFLWLAVWSIWFLLGIGLHHQLPRRNGTQICKLPIDRTSLLGFVGDTDLFTVRRLPNGGDQQPQPIDVYNARTGELVHTISVEPGFNPEVPDRISIRWGVILRRSPDPNHGMNAEHGLHALDLATGKWKELTAKGLMNFAVHPDKPWVAYTLAASRPGGLTIKNLHTGETIFDRKLPAVGGNVAALVFIPDRNAIALREGYAKAISIQVYSLEDDSPPTPAGVDLDLFDDLSASRSGRISLHQPHGWSRPFPPEWNDVYDLVEKRYLSSIPPSERGDARAVAPAGAYRPVISPRGKTMLRGKPPALYHVGDGAVVWRPGVHEKIVGSDGMADRPLPWETGFLVEENWNTLWKRWFPKFQYSTMSRRSLETGELLFRTHENMFVQPEYINAAHTLFVNHDGSVYRDPFGVDWPLLALCQAILALPLVLLWWILRWRRHRAAEEDPVVWLVSE